MAATETEFNRNWDFLLAKCSTDKKRQYLQNSIFPLKDRWTRHHVTKQFNLGILSSQRSESGHSSMKVFLNRMPSLPDLLHHLEKWRAHLEDKTKYQEFRCKTTLDPRIESSLKDIESLISPFAIKCMLRDCESGSHDECRFDHYIKDILIQLMNLYFSNTCTFRVQYRLPCRHEVFRSIAERTSIDINSVDPRWHVPQSTVVSKKRAASAVDLDVIEDPRVTKPKGRPRKRPGRLPSAWEKK